VKGFKLDGHRQAAQSKTMETPTMLQLRMNGVSRSDGISPASRAATLHTLVGSNLLSALSLLCLQLHSWHSRHGVRYAKSRIVLDASFSSATNIRKFFLDVEQEKRNVAWAQEKRSNAEERLDRPIMFSLLKNWAAIARLEDCSDVY